LGKSDLLCSDLMLALPGAQWTLMLVCSMMIDVRFPPLPYPTSPRLLFMGNPAGSSEPVYVAKASLARENGNSLFKIKFWEMIPATSLETGDVNGEDRIEDGQS
jgi:hypothetical protein